MKTFKLKYSKEAKKFLSKCDKYTSKMIYAWLDKNLDGCEDPRAHGKGLTANKSGLWRYRIGDYRLIADIQDDKVIILILEIGHRSKIYE